MIVNGLGFCWVLLGGVFLGGTSQALADELNLPQVMSKAAEASPELASARLRGVAAENQIELARSSFFPTVNLEAMDSTGFPGSTRDLGLGGVVASPFRVGAAAGISARVPLWDFGRTLNAVRAARHQARSQEQEANYIRYQVYQTALELFYQCALYRDYKESWMELAKDAGLVREVVMQFVKKGQRSITEKYLVESEEERARTQVFTNEEREKMQIRELSIFTGLPADGISCPHLPPTDKALSAFGGSPRVNPIILQAQEAEEAARFRLAQARSDYLPKLVGTADLGVMQDVRLVPQNNGYALGIALVFPVFEGFKTESQVSEASALAAAAERDVENRKLEIAELNARFDKRIRASEVSLVHLKDEFYLARQGFNIAKRRYFDLEGDVVDVREAFKNLSRTRIELLTEQESYLESTGAKAILNGTSF